MRYTILMLITITLFQCKQNDPLVVKTESGYVKGVIEDGISVWKGIPYAEAPVGELRWKAPRKKKIWDGVRNTNQYGNICPQTGYGPKSIYEIPSETMSEDCLYLNVWSSNTSPDTLKPVFVWIHGGSLTREGGSYPQYLGKNLAKKGIVYVSINYRLNAFGFLAHPALSEENENGVSGNYGIMDQVAALQWVRDNISQFGGSPDQVTIAGESAGAWSVTILTALPSAKGLFHRAIAQSGAYLWPGPHLKEAKNGYQSAEKEGKRFMEQLGAHTLEELRNVPSDSIRDLFFSPNNSLSSEPVVDGHFLAEDVRSIYEKGKQHPIDIITGANSDEWSLWIPEDLPTDISVYLQQIEMEFPGFSQDFKDLYGIKDSASIAQAYAMIQSDMYFHLHDRKWAEAMKKQGNNVFMYHFSKTPSERYPAKYGAFHGAEIVYALNNLENDPGPIGTGNISEADSAYAEMVSDYWVNFIKTGNPNSKRFQNWPEWDLDNEDYLHFGDTNVESRQFLYKERLDALEKILKDKY